MGNVAVCSVRLWYARDEVVTSTNMQETATDAKNLEKSREVALLLAQNSQNLQNSQKRARAPRS